MLLACRSFIVHCFIQIFFCEDIVDYLIKLYAPISLDSVHSFFAMLSCTKGLYHTGVVAMIDAINNICDTMGLYCLQYQCMDARWKQRALVSAAVGVKHLLLLSLWPHLYTAHITYSVFIMQEMEKQSSICLKSVSSELQ